MIRWCINWKQIFGCQGFDGKKWTCDSCDYYGTCATRLIVDPPVQEITGGICDWCFDNLKIAKHTRYLKNQPLTAGHDAPAWEERRGRSERMTLIFVGLMITAFAGGMLLGFEWPKLREAIRIRHSKMEFGIWDRREGIMWERMLRKPVCKR